MSVSLLSRVLPVILLLCLSCGKSGDVASGGSHLFLTANPQQISLSGTSTLTVTGADENGAPLPDGTQVSFSVTEAGRVEPSSVRLAQGRATSTYFATVFAGDITITATSGSIQASTTVTVADNIEQNVYVSASPETLPTGGGTSIISAVVTDGAGQPLQGIGVRFSTTSGTLASAGAVIRTNATGVAGDTLNTTSDATVTATTDDGFNGQTTIRVGVGRIVCHMSVSTNTPRIGQTVFFFDTSDDPDSQIDRYLWDFGDGSLADGQNVQHVYSTEGTFNVLHSVTDVLGNTISCNPFPLQVSP
jgi:hypothetical protein